MTKKDAVSEIMVREGYTSMDMLARDWAYMVALSNIEKFRAECEYFQNKYGMDFTAFDRHIHGQKGHEDFVKEEDFEDWEFAQNARRWWEEKLDELQSAQNH
jgi:hypothetical protein